MTTIDPGIRFPGESEEYRQARNRLLQAESELRRAIEQVATQRRALPPGGVVPEDYRFDEGASCTSILDSLDGAAPHLAQRLNLAVVAKSSPERIRAFAHERGWRDAGLESRHVDSIWPIWNVLDLTLDGRGSESNYPSLRYD